MSESAASSLERAGQSAARGACWEAACHLRRALASREFLGEAWSVALKIAQSIADDHGAVLAARRLYDESFRQPGSAFLLAEALTQAGRPDESVALLVPLANCGKLTDDQSFRLTRMLMLAGRLPEAQARARALLASHPDSPTLWERIAQTKCFTVNDPDIDTMRRLFDRSPGMRPAVRAAIAAALAKAYVDIGEDRGADQCLEACAAANGARYAFESSLLLDALRDILTWTASVGRGPAGEDGGGTERPVFVLGPARSGTSLIDQILSRHPEIRGGGELKHFWLAGRELGDCSTASLDAWVRRQPSDDAAGPWLEIGRHYLALADERFGAGTRFTDKLLSNLYRVRAIRNCLPGARFIYVKRDPLDVAWSCWRTQFDADSGWSGSARGVALYVLAYQRAMAAWMQRYPERITEVSYERLTRDPEREIRKLLAACGLADDRGTRQPELSDRPVITMSFAQAREPIHTRSVGAAASFPVATGRLRAALETVEAELP